MKNVYQTRFAINGDVIDEFKTYEDAEEAIQKYEEEDKKNGNYEPGEYEVFSTYLDMVVNDEDKKECKQYKIFVNIDNEPTLVLNSEVQELVNNNISELWHRWNWDGVYFAKKIKIYELEEMDNYDFKEFEDYWYSEDWEQYHFEDHFRNSIKLHTEITGLDHNDVFYGIDWGTEEEQEHPDYNPDEVLEDYVTELIDELLDDYSEITFD